MRMQLRYSSNTTTTSHQQNFTLSACSEISGTFQL
jgi:hypothetical protein